MVVSSGKKANPKRMRKHGTIGTLFHRDLLYRRMIQKFGMYPLFNGSNGGLFPKWWFFSITPFGDLIRSLWQPHSSLLKMTISSRFTMIYPEKNVMFHSYGNVYQRVCPCIDLFIPGDFHGFPVFPWCTSGFGKRPFLGICFTSPSNIFVGDYIPKWLADVQLGHLPTPDMYPKVLYMW